MCVFVFSDRTKWNGDFWWKTVSLKLQTKKLFFLNASFVLCFEIRFLGGLFWQTSLMCIVGELEGGESGALAVGVGDS